MDKIIEILMRRDDISKFEAEQIVYECGDVMSDAIAMGASYDEIADIIKDYLELEPDYMEYFLDEWA